MNYPTLKDIRDYKKEHTLSYHENNVLLCAHEGTIIPIPPKMEKFLSRCKKYIYADGLMYFTVQMTFKQLIFPRYNISVPYNIIKNEDNIFTVDIYRGLLACMNGNFYVYGIVRGSYKNKVRFENGYTYIPLKNFLFSTISFMDRKKLFSCFEVNEHGIYQWKDEFGKIEIYTHKVLKELPHIAYLNENEWTYIRKTIQSAQIKNELYLYYPEKNESLYDEHNEEVKIQEDSILLVKKIGYYLVEEKNTMKCVFFLQIIRDMITITRYNKYVKISDSSILDKLQPNVPPEYLTFAE